MYQIPYSKKKSGGKSRWIALFLVCFQLTLPGQVKRAAHWYFGYKAGLNFSGGTAAADLSGQMETIEGCASISDTSGNLLFYANGQSVWNSAGQLMPNSTGLTGDQSSTQGVIVVPDPGSNSLHYLFSTIG